MRRRAGPDSGLGLWTIGLVVAAIVAATVCAPARALAETDRLQQAVNYVFSYGSCSIQGFSQQYQAGYEASIPAANKIYPVKGTRLCPPQTQQDVNTQINQIQAKLNVGAVDCLSIEPQSSTSMAPLVEAVLKKGIPVFTVGLSTFGNELTNFTQVPLKEGATAAATVLSYMKAHNLHFKTFAVSGGDPTQYWAQKRAQGFRQAILIACLAAVAAIYTCAKPSSRSVLAA